MMADELIKDEGRVGISESEWMDNNEELVDWNIFIWDYRDRETVN
jgi:hypothetical protein